MFASTPTDEVTARIGPSVANGSKPVKRHYGTDDELLEQQNHLLNARKGPVE